MHRLRVEPPDTGNQEALRADFLELKIGQGLYQFQDDGVVLGERGMDGTPFTLEFQWPRRAPPAVYQIAVYEVKDGQVVEESVMPLRVARTGFPEWLARFAENQAALYGAAAVVIATLSGFGIDLLTMMLFGKKRATSH